MLGINPIKSANAAKDYYHNDDYYSSGRSVIGQWFGQGATMLGLGCNVSKQAFARLCDNLHPISRGQITGRMNDNRRPGYDFTYSLWKSASVLLTLYGDGRILEVFSAAVLSTMVAIEPFMEARVRVGGAEHNRVTGNMVAAPFLHWLTRPEAGVPDPHTHTHFVGLNMTWDEMEEKWKAGEFGQIKSMGQFFEELFDAKLAEGFRGLGYQVERRGPTQDYEIKDVPDEIVDKFSQRTKVIEQKAVELGITDPKEKASLGKHTRKAKIADLDEEALMAIWKGRLTSDEDQALKKLVEDAALRGPVVPESHPNARQMVDYAVKHLFERCSVVEEHHVLAAAMAYGAGAVSVDDLKEALETADIIREVHEGKVLLTTELVLNEEADCVAFVKETRGTLSRIRRVNEAPDSTLSSEQWAAFQHVMESQDRVTALCGSPGSGKTTIMNPIVDSIKKTGLEVLTFAPSAEASRKVLRGEGFLDADTLTRFLLDENLQRKAEGQVVWIDEAGLIGAADMHRLFTLAHERNFRLVLSGDIDQHAPVARGDALRLLINHAGLKPIEVKTVRRQQLDIYREAVQAITDGELEAGFGKLDEAGFIREIVDESDRLEQLAQAYLRVSSEESALIVSPTHKEGAKVTRLVRRKMQEAGKLASKESDVMQLEETKWSTAERSNPALYQIGMVVQFHQNAVGKIFRGDRFTVTAVAGQDIEIRKGQGRPICLPLSAASHFKVYEEKTLPVAVGEVIRITANGTSKNQKKLENGSLHRIASISRGGDLVCDNGLVLDANYGHLAYGYCATSISSQGKTVDHVLIAQSAESLGKAASRQQFLVSVSRGRHSVEIFTENKERLFRAVEKSSARPSAHDIVSEKRRQHALSQSKFRTVIQRTQTIKEFRDEISPHVPETEVGHQDFVEQPETTERGLDL